MVEADLVRCLATAAVKAGLAEPRKRGLLLFGIEQAVVYSIPIHPEPSLQVFEDLIHLRPHPMALREWLKNALTILPPCLPDRADFESALIVVGTGPPEHP